MQSEALRLSREIIAVHSKSFSLASRLLPPKVRDRAVVVYAWCRRADDAVDLAEPGQVASSLARLRRELDVIYSDDPLTDPILEAFREVARERHIPRLYPQELLEGLAMDVAETSYEDTSTLLLYCYRVAGVVGLMMCHVMGVADEGATHNAVHLGVAMQLTNICRDVLEDWERRRLYVPTDILAQHGCGWLSGELGGPFPERAREPVARATSQLLDLSDEYYRSGNAGILALSSRCGLAVRTASRVYAAIGNRIRAHSCDPLAGRAWVTTAGKMPLLGRAILDSLGRTGATGPLTPTQEIRAEQVLPVTSLSPSSIDRRELS